MENIKHNFRSFIIIYFLIDLVKFSKEYLSNGIPCLKQNRHFCKFHEMSLISRVIHFQHHATRTPNSTYWAVFSDSDSFPQDLPRTEYPLLDCLHETYYRTFTLHLQTAAVHSVFYAFRLCQIDTYRVLWWCYERLEKRPPGGWPYRCKRVRTVTSVIIACSLSALGVRWCYSRLHGVHLLKIHT